LLNEGAAHCVVRIQIAEHTKPPPEGDPCIGLAAQHLPGFKLRAYGLNSL